MKNIIAILIITFATTTVFAAGRAKVEVTAKKISEQKVELTFKTVPSDGLSINAEGPWKLEIKDPGSLKFEKLELKRADWKEKDAAFTQTASIAAKAKSSAVAYKLTAFVCTKDKGQCFREVIESKSDLSW